MKRFGLFLVIFFVFSFLFGCDFFGNSTTTTATTSSDLVTTTTTTTSSDDIETTTTQQVTTTTTTTTTAAQTTTTTTTTGGQINTTTTTTTTAPLTTTTTTSTQTTTTTTNTTLPSSGVLMNEIVHLFPAAVNWYEIPLQEDGLFKAYTLGNVDTYCIVYDSQLNILFEDDDSGFSTNCLAENYLESGMYYVTIMGYDDVEEGDYQMVVELTPSSEMTYLLNSDTNLIANSVDRFDFTVTQAGYFTAYTQGFVDTFGYLYNSEDQELFSSDDDGTNYNIRFDCYLLPGTYYITVEGYDELEAGDYRMVAYFTPEASQDHFFSQGGTLVADGTIEYTITITEPGYLTAYTIGDLDTFGYLLNSNEDVLKAVDEDGYGNNFKIECIVLPGTYYIDVMGYDETVAGDFRLNVDFTPAVVSGHFMSEKGHIDLGGGYVMYDITVIEAGYLLIYAESGIDTYGYLYDDEMALIVENDESNGYADFLILYQAQPGTYHLKVSGYDETDEGDYELLVDFIPLGQNNFYYYFSVFGEVLAGVGGTYQVTFSQPGYITAYTISSTDTYGEMYNSGSVLIADDDDTYSDYNFIIGTAIEAGTYTFVITGYDESTFGDYLFVVNYYPNMD